MYEDRLTATRDYHSLLVCCNVDFAANQFNFGKGNEHLGNRVTLVSKTGAYTCRIHPDGTTATQIVCITPYVA